MIRVLRHAAAHAARVVGQDSAHPATGDRRRIGPDLSAVEPQRVIRLLADQPRLYANRLAVLLDAHMAPVATDIHQDAVGNRLAGEAGAPGAKDQRNGVAMAEAEQVLDLLRGRGLDHGAGDQPVEARVRGEGHQFDGADEDTLGVDQLPQQMPDLDRIEHRFFGFSRDCGFQRVWHCPSALDFLNLMLPAKSH
jgi:hypothetical protein